MGDSLNTTPKALKVTFQFSRHGQCILEDHYTDTLIFDVVTNAFNVVDEGVSIPVTTELVDVITIKNV